LERPLLAILYALYTLFLAYILFDVISYCAAGRWYDFRAVIAVVALPPVIYPSDSHEAFP